MELTVNEVIMLNRRQVEDSFVLLFQAIEKEDNKAVISHVSSIACRAFQDLATIAVCISEKPATDVAIKDAIAGLDVTIAGILRNRG